MPHHFCLDTVAQASAASKPHLGPSAHRDPGLCLSLISPSKFLSISCQSLESFLNKGKNALKLYLKTHVCNNWIRIGSLQDWNQVHGRLGEPPPFQCMKLLWVIGAQQPAWGLHWESENVDSRHVQCAGFYSNC